MMRDDVVTHSEVGYQMQLFQMLLGLTQTTRADNLGCF